MVQTLCRFLIKNNEGKLFNIFLEDQSRVYLSRDLVFKALDTACRYMRPRMAIKLLVWALLAQKNDDDNNFIDAANLMPDPDTTVTMHDVRETQIIVRCLYMNHDLNVKKIVTKVSLYQLNFQLSRELMDKFLSYILENQMIRILLDFKKGYKEEKQVQIDILSELYHRCSPPLISKLVQ